MDYEHILVEVEDGVGIATLNRPDKLNAMNRRLSSELHDAVKRFEADDAVACVVITGAGRAFSAGGDSHEQREDDRRYTAEELDKMRSGRSSLEIAACAKPVIGMINGSRLWRRRGVGLLARHAGRLRGYEIPLSGRRLWPDQQHLDIAEPGRLADGQGTLVHRTYRGGGGGLPHRSSQSPRAARAAESEDDGAWPDDRR